MISGIDLTLDRQFGQDLFEKKDRAGFDTGFLSLIRATIGSIKAPSMQGSRPMESHQHTATC
jgi:hypothetical protein